MKCVNVLNEEVKEVEPITIISDKKTYLVSIPHGGEFFPIKFLDKLNPNFNLTRNIDHYTTKLYKNLNSFNISFNLTSDFINLSRNRVVDYSQPIHLKTDPIHPLKVMGEALLKEEYSKEDEEEIYKIYEEYHKLISNTLEMLKRENSFALMLDGHSLYSIGPENTPDEGQERADFVVGTLNDNSAHPEIINAFCIKLGELANLNSMSVVKNKPYKGGYNTQKYSNPSEDIHVIQLEVNKKQYMDEKTLEIKTESVNLINKLIEEAMNAAFEKAKEIYFGV
ncbi:N-formylglutamate amidohydrolase [Candidatus Woesearchaeota archaeon]|nr:N-formylglutamate amidohydrolase [Candidatus Woesearchaeota archaeon]